VELEAAQALLVSRAQPITGRVTLPLSEALGLAAGEALYAPVDNPPFDRSPLDGFALRSEDAKTAGPDHPLKFRVAASLSAGEVYARPLGQGEALRIMTGAAMPPGADCMIPKEAVREVEDGVLIFQPLKRHENYIFQGEDIKQGQLLIAQGERLGFAQLGILAAMGLERVSVLRPCRAGVLCTGDELSPPGKPLEPGKIYDSNGVMLAARLEELGIGARRFPSMGDDAAAACEKIRAYIEEIDLLITTGAVSVGDKDIMPQVLHSLGAEILVRRMNHKPGSAILCGVYRDKLILGLSGNPFAALTTLELLGRPVLARLTGRRDLECRPREAALFNPFPGGRSAQRRFIRARLEERDRDLPWAVLPQGHASGQLFSLLNCNCLIDIPEGRASLPAGSLVQVLAF
jgi:molybdopterin molybdotransferase